MNANANKKEKKMENKEMKRALEEVAIATEKYNESPNVYLDIAIRRVDRLINEANSAEDVDYYWILISDLDEAVDFMVELY